MAWSTIMSSDAKSGIGRANQARRRILENDVTGAYATHRRIILRRHALGGFFHQEDADAVFLALAAAGSRRDDQLVRPGRAQHHAFLAVEHIAIALLLRGGGDVRQIVAALRFGEGERDNRFAGGDFGQHLFRQRTAAFRQQTTRDHHGRHERLDHQGAAEFLHHHHAFDRTTAQAAEFLRQGAANSPNSANCFQWVGSRPSGPRVNLRQSS